MDTEKIEEILEKDKEAFSIDLDNLIYQAYKNERKALELYGTENINAETWEEIIRELKKISNDYF